MKPAGPITQFLIQETQRCHLSSKFSDMTEVAGPGICFESCRIKYSTGSLLAVTMYVAECLVVAGVAETERDGGELAWKPEKFCECPELRGKWIREKPQQRHYSLCLIIF